VLTVNLYLYTIKPVLRGHLYDKEKVTLYDRWPLIRGSIHMKFSITGQEMWPFNTGDCLIEVTTLACLTVNYYIK